MKALYLDNAATTKVSDEVIEEMIKSMKNNYGNSEAKYYAFSENAKKDIALSRNRIAAALGCNISDIIFTSGATESNNLFIKGYADAHPEKKKIIISSIEHSSVLEPCLFLEKKGYELKIIDVDKTGRILIEELEKEIDDNTLFVSIIMVNNEIGTIQDVEEIDKVCKRKNVVLHMDATQAVGKIKIDFSKFDSLRFLTISSHKIYGPKGIGALLVKNADEVKKQLTPLFHGGEQELGYRAGTLSNELIVGFGKAVEYICKNIDENNKKMAILERKIISIFEKKVGDNFIINNNFSNRVSGMLNIRFTGINNMVLLKRLAPVLAASTGSACSVSKPSRVLKAIGLNDEEISYSIRLSFSIYQTEKDLEALYDYL